MHHRRIIKQGPVVIATREDGSLDPAAASSQGLFLADTRYLSRFQIRLNNLEPVLLGSTEEILFEASYLLTNPPLTGIPARGIGILARNGISDGAVQMNIRVANWALVPIQFELSIELDSDFYDSFEARGVKRLKRGDMSPPKATDDCLELQYVGLDHVTRTTIIDVKPSMQRFEEKRMCFPIQLGINDQTTIELTIMMKEHSAEPDHDSPQPKVQTAAKPEWFDECASIHTSNALVDQILQRSVDDIEVLLTEYMGYCIPSAGLPRFAVPFGRDAIITSLQTLVWNPHIARDVLYFLSATQGKEENPWNYEQPGKSCTRCIRASWRG